MRRVERLGVDLAVLALLALTLLILWADHVQAGDGVTGTASWYGPGDGVATPGCSWTQRTTVGCGWLRIQSNKTGLVVVAPIVDWCQCYRRTRHARIVDLQWGVVRALGLKRSAGTYSVTIWHVGRRSGGLVSVPTALPNTAMARP